MQLKRANNHMKINKTSILIIGLMFIIIFLSYNIIDKSITLTYSNQGCESSRGDIDNLLSLIEKEWIGMDVKIIENKMKTPSTNKNSIIPQIKMENDLIWYGDVRFIFHSGRLEKIEY